jgi:hypothetical protein
MKIINNWWEINLNMYIVHIRYTERIPHTNIYNVKALNILVVDPSVTFVCLDSSQEEQPPVPAYIAHVLHITEMSD